MTPPNSQTPQADVISAFEWCEKHIPCFDANDNYYKKVIKSLENRHAAMRQSERTKVKELVDFIEIVATFDGRNRIGHLKEYAKEVLAKFQTPEGV